MNAADRTIVTGDKPGPIYQGESEEVVYGLDITEWGSTPTDTSAYLFDDDNDDVTSAHLFGTTSVDGNVITLPTLKLLKSGRKYRLEVRFTTGGQKLTAVTEVVGQH